MDYRISTKKTWSQTNTELQAEFELWGVKDWETNYPRGARLEGQNQSEQDRTVQLTYIKNGKEIKLAMGRQNRAVDNLRVLYLAIQSMRLNEKRGIGEVLESAYLQLNAPIPTKDPYELLGVRPDAPIEVVEAAYKAKVKQVHPDLGGSEQEMKMLNDAIQQIRHTVA